VDSLGQPLLPHLVVALEVLTLGDVDEDGAEPVDHLLDQVERLPHHALLEVEEALHPVPQVHPRLSLPTHLPLGAGGW